MNKHNYALYILKYNCFKKYNKIERNLTLFDNIINSIKHLD